VRIQAVFLDLDGTLLNYEGVDWADTVREVCTELGQSRPGLDTARLFTSYTKRTRAYFAQLDRLGTAWDLANADGFDVWRNMWSQALSECGYSQAAAADEAVDRYTADRAARYRLFEDALPCIAELRARVGRLAIITNGPGKTQQHKIDATGLTDLVDAVVTSGAAGVAKPDPAIFEIAAKELGVPSASAWHVGDSMAADIAGARRAGLAAAIWLDRRPRRLRNLVRQAVRRSPRPHHTVSSLSELPALLPN